MIQRANGMAAVLSAVRADGLYGAVTGRSTAVLHHADLHAVSVFVAMSLDSHPVPPSEMSGGHNPSSCSYASTR